MLLLLYAEPARMRQVRRLACGRGLCAVTSLLHTDAGLHRRERCRSISPNDKGPLVKSARQLGVWKTGSEQAACRLPQAAASVPPRFEFAACMQGYVSGGSWCLEHSLSWAACPFSYLHTEPGVLVAHARPSPRHPVAG